MNTSFSSIVVHGNKRGKALGFPTANQKLNQKIDEGIYISYSMYEGKKYQSLTFIGAAQTFDETIYQAETYIFEFDQDIYDTLLDVTLVKKLRDNQKFESVEKLIIQMEKDKKDAIEFFKVEEAS